MEARDEKRLLRLQRELQAAPLLIVNELAYVPLSPTGAELLFEVFSQRYEHGSTIVTSNLPFEEWTAVFGSERLTGALLDRLTHHVCFLAVTGESVTVSLSPRLDLIPIGFNGVEPLPFGENEGASGKALSQGPGCPEQRDRS
ncbi:ATP-binding protein [Paeniroseomonas aquatica]|uniref:ATP-binding protein n=1 Tax=Paeniroseomonas aquatica TaxID=373043 RepID=A0ABT8A5B2_9PROT|nr:ATP-binding protein [Paeniroseomonas aquatica]MDN3564972.1 ATP-binding protein [Paeniroseomonas aquatica]